MHCHVFDSESQAGTWIGFRTDSSDLSQPKIVQLNKRFLCSHTIFASAKSVPFLRFAVSWGGLWEFSINCVNVCFNVFHCLSGCVSLEVINNSNNMSFKACWGHCVFLIYFFIVIVLTGSCVYVCVDSVKYETNYYLNNSLYSSSVPKALSYVIWLLIDWGVLGLCVYILQRRAGVCKERFVFVQQIPEYYT